MPKLNSRHREISASKTEIMPKSSSLTRAFRFILGHSNWSIITWHLITKERWESGKNPLWILLESAGLWAVGGRARHVLPLAVGFPPAADSQERLHSPRRGCDTDWQCSYLCALKNEPACAQWHPGLWQERREQQAQGSDCPPVLSPAQGHLKAVSP